MFGNPTQPPIHVSCVKCRKWSHTGTSPCHRDAGPVCVGDTRSCQLADGKGVGRGGYALEPLARLAARAPRFGAVPARGHVHELLRAFDPGGLHGVPQGLWAIGVLTHDPQCA